MAQKRKGKRNEDHLFLNFVLYAKTKFNTALTGNLACDININLQLRNSSGFSPDSPVFCQI